MFRRSSFPLQSPYFTSHLVVPSSSSCKATRPRKTQTNSEGAWALAVLVLARLGIMKYSSDGLKYHIERAEILIMLLHAVKINLSFLSKSVSFSQRIRIECQEK